MQERFTTAGVSPSEIDTALDDIWKGKQLRSELVKAGLDPAALGAGPNPFKAEPAEDQFGIAETIFIGVATGAGTYLAKKTIDEVWPLVRRLVLHTFGARLEPAPDDTERTG